MNQETDLYLLAHYLLFIPDDEGGSSLYSKFGAKLSAGAVSVGKRAAKSEAGKKAGRAAVKGACDSARDDMMDRYFGPGGETKPTSPTSKAPSKPEAPAASQSVSPSKPKQDDSYSYSAPSSTSTGGGQEWSSARPPKPSLLGKFKFSKGSSSQSKPRPRPIRDPKKKVYKHRLAQSADWDRLPMAQALFNFKGEMKCDLEFRKGQVIYVLTRTDTQNDWWEGKLEDRVGIFPANYVKMM